MSGLTIAHKDPAAAEVFAPTLEVLKQDVADKAAALVAAAGFEISDAASFAKANDMATVMHATEKAIEARRLYLKRPLTDVGRLIEGAVDGVAAPLSLARKSLIGRIAAWDKKQKDAAAAEARKAQEAAEAERQAKQKLADEAHAKEVAAAQEKARQDAAELEAIMGSPVKPEPVVVAPAPVVKVEPVAVAAPAPPSAVTTRMVPELVVDEDHPALAAFKVGGEMLVQVNRAAVKRVLDAGAVLPWARVVMREQVAQKAVRA